MELGSFDSPARKHLVGPGGMLVAAGWVLGLQGVDARLRRLLISGLNYEPGVHLSGCER